MGFFHRYNVFHNEGSQRPGDEGPPPPSHLLSACRGMFRAPNFLWPADEPWTAIEKDGHVEIFFAESISPAVVCRAFGDVAAREFISIMAHLREYKKFYQLHEKARVRQSCVYGENVVYSNGNYYWKEHGVLTAIAGKYAAIVNFIRVQTGKVWWWMRDHPTPFREYSMPFCTTSPGCYNEDD